MSIARFVKSSLVYILRGVLCYHISNVPQASSPWGQAAACSRRASYRPLWGVECAVSVWSNWRHLEWRLLAVFLSHLWEIFTKLIVKWGSLHPCQALIAFHAPWCPILGLLWRGISVRSNSLTLIDLCWYLLKELISDSSGWMNLLSNIHNLLRVVSNSKLHEFGHLFVSHYWLRILEPVFAHELCVQEVVHGSDFFKELFIIEEVDCGEYSFEGPTPPEFIFRVFE